MKDENFDFEDFFEDVKSSSDDKSQEFEDIISDSQYSYFIGNEPHSHAKKHKKSFKRWWKHLTKGKKAALISATSVFLAIVILVVWFFTTFNYRYNEITEEPEELGFEEVIDERIVNVALFGIDTRTENSFKGNSDSIMILSLNTKTKKVKIISIMRDTLTPIERNGSTSYKKINSAYGLGGPELAIKTINKVFNLDISEYATVNFYGMSDIIDAVGGIDATLTEREVTARGENNHGINDMISEICSYLKYNPKDYFVTQAGEQHLNGVQAVAYARIRYVPNIWGTNNDYGRTDRQRYVMEQLFNKAKTLNKTQYGKLAKALIPCSETSLSYGEIMNLAVSMLLHQPTFEQARIPGDDFQMTSPSGSFGSVVYYDLDYSAKIIHAFIYDDIPFETYIAEHGIEKNDWYRNRVGSSGSGTSASTPKDTSSVSSETPVTSSEPTSSVPPTDSSSTDSSENTSSTDESSSDTSSGDSSDSSDSSQTSSEATSTETGTSTSDAEE